MNQLYPLAKMSEEFLLIHPDDKVFLADIDILPLMRGVVVDLAGENISESIFVDRHFKLNPWEIISSEKEREEIISKVHKKFSKKDIDTHMVFPLDLYKIRSMNETLEGLGENNNENE